MRSQLLTNSAHHLGLYGQDDYVSIGNRQAVITISANGKGLLYGLQLCCAWVAGANVFGGDTLFA